MRAHNPELDDFFKGRERALNRAILRLLAEEPGLNVYRICERVSASDFGPVRYSTVYRRVFDLSNEAFWWLHGGEVYASMRNPSIASRRFSLSLHGVLAFVALWYDDPVAVADLKRNYDLFFPVYFANRLNHSLADEWLFGGIGEVFRDGMLSINMSWDFFMIHATFHLARRRRVMEKEGKDVRELGITEELFTRFWKDTAKLPQSGWDKVTRMYDPKNGIDKKAIEMLKPQAATPFKERG